MIAHYCSVRKQLNATLRGVALALAVVSKVVRTQGHIDGLEDFRHDVPK